MGLLPLTLDLGVMAGAIAVAFREMAVMAVSIYDLFPWLQIKGKYTVGIHYI